MYKGNIVAGKRKKRVVKCLKSLVLKNWNIQDIPFIKETVYIFKSDPPFKYLHAGITAIYLKPSQ